MNDRIAKVFLLASAFVVGALLIVQAGRIEPASAEMVTQSSEYVSLTTNGGTSELALVIDKRTEELSVYRVEALSTIELYQRIDLPRVFADARARSEGGR